jgi:hypothetical protein
LAIQNRGGRCLGTDLTYRGFGEGGVDFFSTTKTADNIISNPPYNRINFYIPRALKKTSKKVVLLARLTLLEGQARRTMFEYTPLARVWVSSRRVSMSSGGSSVEAKGGAIAYAWFVWEHGYSGKPTIGWL